MTFYRDAEFIPFFHQDWNLVYCNNVKRDLLCLSVQDYNANFWRLFIESSKHSLKIVLMLSTNIKGSIPIRHSSTLEEKHESIKQVMKRIKYTKHNWVICLDLKMVNFLLGQQSGYTKFPCFCTCGTVKWEIITGKERTGRFEHDWKVAKKM